jgi:predicted CXXCH cytochrome family protein
VALLCLGITWPPACGAREESDGGTHAGTTPQAAADAPIPEQLAACHACHRSIVEAYAAHGMARSLGPVRDPPRGTVVNTRTGTRYEFAPSSEGTLLTATALDGGVRRQRVVGRLGAGLIDRSFVTVELAEDGRLSDRLQFAPIELLTGHGLALSPFEQDAHPAGLDQPVTARCLGCHTTRPVRGPASGASGTDYPRNRLGHELIEQLPPLDCTACHGATDRHVAIMREEVSAAPDDIGITRLGDLDAATRRDVCARCHLEGDAHLALTRRTGYGPRSTPLAAVRPVLVPTRPVEDHRLVSQEERLSLSACALGSPDMTCTSCHEPHRAVASQGIDAFDAACLGCHTEATAACSRETGLKVPEVTGEPARSEKGCVDCHVRRSQPFDVPGLRSADHFVQRRIPPPGRPGMRHVADPGGPLTVHHDERLAALLATPGGARWVRGLVGLGYFQQGRMQDAAAQLASFPPPGTPEALQPNAPEGLEPLETSADFHHLRGLVLETVGDPEGARAAYSDALVCDAAFPEARLNRGLLRLLAGDTAGCLQDAEALLRLYPHAEKGWNLLARARAALGDLPGAAEALRRSVQAWPADPGTWHELGRLELRLGDRAAATEALRRARSLQPSRPGLAGDLAAAAGR